MSNEVGRHLRLWRQQRWEGLLVGLDDRVSRIHHVIGHLAGIGIDDYLHRISHVVIAARKATSRGELEVAGILCIGIALGCGVAVEDPLDLPPHHHRIGIGIKGQEGRCLGGHDLDVTDEHDAALGCDQVRDQQVEIAKAEGEGGSPERPGKLDSTRSGIVILDVNPLGRLIVELGLL